MSEKHNVIFIPGLNDGGSQPNRIECAVQPWKKYDLEPMIFRVGWHDGEKLGPKLARFGQLVERMYREGDSVDIVGMSEGGSFALNAFFENQDYVNRVVSVCARLKKGDGNFGFRTFKARTASSPAFVEPTRLLPLN